MPKGTPLGYIDVRIPISVYKQSESWEIPEEYEVMDMGKAEIIGHTIPERYWQSMSMGCDISDAEFTFAEFDEDKLQEKWIPDGRTGSS